MLEQYAAGFAVSGLSIGLYWLMYRKAGCRPRTLSVLLGAVPVSIAALFLELAAFAYVSIFMALVIVSPLVEELLKFLASRHGRDTAAGLGTGLGFALTENALYFGAFLQTHYSILYLLGFLFMRGATDPVLHSFTSSTSVASWQTGKIRFILLAVLLHGLYNLAALAGGSNLELLLPATGAVAILMLTGSLLSLKPSRKQQRARASMPESGSYTTYQDGSRWCAACSSSLPLGLNIAAHEHSEPHLSAIRASAEELPGPAAVPAFEEKAARPLGAAPDPGPDREGFLSWMDTGARTNGFQAVAAELGLQGGYAAARWVRHSFYSGDKGRAHYWELGTRATFLLISVCAAAGLILWAVLA